MFVRGSLDFYPGVSPALYLEGCQLFMVGSTIYLLLALFAAHEVNHLLCSLCLPQTPSLFSVLLTVR